MIVSYPGIAFSSPHLNWLHLRHIIKGGLCHGCITDTESGVFPSSFALVREWLPRWDQGMSIYSCNPGRGVGRSNNIRYERTCARAASDLKTERWSETNSEGMESQRGIIHSSGVELERSRDIYVYIHPAFIADKFSWYCTICSGSMWP